jgi:hypothetical protein
MRRLRDYSSSEIVRSSENGTYATLLYKFVYRGDHSSHHINLEGIACVSFLFCLGLPSVRRFSRRNQRTSVQSFLDHADKIDILVPTWYSTDVHGMVWGGPNPQVMQVAREHHVAVMPIIGGSAMGTAEYHQFFNDEAARHAMDEALVRICIRISPILKSWTSIAVITT